MRILLTTPAMWRLVLSLSILLPAQSLLAHDLPTHDAMKAAPAHHKLLLENVSVRVLETRILPGERAAVHSHPWPAVQYVVSFSDFIRYDPEGKVLVDSRNMVSKPAPGTALWSPPVPLHYIQNVGATDLLVIAVEIKPRQ
jgi:quercetin dioxygenase-like cupin family protein